MEESGYFYCVYFYLLLILLLLVFVMLILLHCSIFIIQFNSSETVCILSTVMVEFFSLQLAS